MLNRVTDQLFSSGVDRSELSDSVRAQDNFFDYVNAEWAQRTPIPDDKARYGSFDMLADGAEAAVRVIVEEAKTAPEGSEARKIGDLYASFLDEERVNARGVEPLSEPLADIDAVTSVADLLREIGQIQRHGLGGFLGFGIDNDPGNPERYIVVVEQGGISLPDETYYREEQFADIRVAFVAHIARMFALAGFDDVDARAQRVFALETKIAKHHWDTVDSRDNDKTYNPMTWSAFSELFASTLTSKASLALWLGGLDAPAGSFDEVVVHQPSFVGALGELVVEDDLESWKDWLRWHLIHGSSPYLSASLVDETFDFFSRTLIGTKVNRERWKRGVSFVTGALGEAIGKIYVERHYPPSVKARMDTLVANLVEAYRESITHLEWMGEATRQRALEKLDSFTPKIGYPARWRDYSALEVTDDDLIANVRAASEFEFNRQFAKIGQPVDRDEWFMNPQTVNAYYNPGMNEVVFPAAIIQPPFFDPLRDEAGNYGGIGAVIGHEIGHGFDDQGSKFDGTGKLNDWWEASDREAFEVRTKSLIEQYDALSPRETPGLHVNGAFTIGENIGDLGGLGIAWKAYLISLNGAAPEVIDGLSASQRFFLAWALCWRTQSRKEIVEMLLAADPHSPPQFRCNQIVRNLDEFYRAFDVEKSDAMWLEPSERVVIW